MEREQFQHPTDNWFAPQNLSYLQEKYTQESWKRLLWCRSKVTSAFEIAALMSVFSLITTVEIPLPTNNEANPTLIIIFVSISCNLVAVTVIIRVMTMIILPHLDGTIEMSIKDSMAAPHDQIINWIFFTCFLGHTIAPILFCLDMIVISWIKFPHFAKEAPYAVTAIMTPMIGVILVFGNVFYKHMQKFKLKMAEFQTGAIFPGRRYSDIAEEWENGSNSSLSEISVHNYHYSPVNSDEDDGEESLLLKSCNFGTSYGAMYQTEYAGRISSVFADIRA